MFSPNSGVRSYRWPNLGALGVVQHMCVEAAVSTPELRELTSRLVGVELLRTTSKGSGVLLQTLLDDLSALATNSWERS